MNHPLSRRAVALGSLTSLLACAPEASPPGDQEEVSSLAEQDAQRPPATATGRLLVTELMYDPSLPNDNPGEWFELFNPSLKDTVNIKDWKLSDGGTGSTADTFTIKNDLYIGPRQYVILADASNLGNSAFGVTADYVYPHTTSQPKMNFDDTKDTLLLIDGLGSLITQIAYDEANGWKAASGASLSLAGSLQSETYVEMKSAWCVSTSGPTASDRGTPKRAGDTCANVDKDGDGAWGTADTNDNSYACLSTNTELVNNGQDEDCDGIDPTTVYRPLSLPTTSYEGLAGISVGWSTSELVLSFEHASKGNPILLLMDTGLEGGENDFRATKGYTGSYPSELTPSLRMDVLIASPPTSSVAVFSVADNTSTNRTSVTSAAYKGWYVGDGRGNHGVVRLPWTLLYGSNFPRGTTLRLFAAVREASTEKITTIYPTNTSTAVTSYVTVVVDADRDGSPDKDPFADVDRDGFASSQGDCDDLDAEINPDAAEVCDDVDNNCDGVTDPPAEEICNGIDDDCDQKIDEEGGQTYYLDADGDGHGDPTADPLITCAEPTGYVTNAQDCDDGDDGVNPKAEEICDGADQDCDEIIDEGVASTFFQDSDNDGFGDPGKPVEVSSCTPPTGTSANAQDCNDASAGVFPGAPETCNGIDDDCDGSADEGVMTLFYRDDDGDTYGVEASSIEACSRPRGYTDTAGDCDDTSSAAYPGAPLLCDGLDNNCDGVGDRGEGFDQDGDEHLDSKDCATGDDCDDTNPAVYAGAGEQCNGVDDDCDGSTDDEFVDNDGDDFSACVGPGKKRDCNDNNPAINPNAPESCDGQDSDCDGEIPATEGDADLDDYRGCAEGDKAADCNDADPLINPGETEICDAKDNDCDQQIDDGLNQTWYADDDGDGFGDPNSDVVTCLKPFGYTTEPGDCDDTTADIRPGAEEVCDGVDNNCDGTTDEGFDADGIGGGDCTDDDDDSHSEEGGDCNDGEGAIHPGAEDDPFDGVDSDCGGEDETPDPATPTEAPTEPLATEPPTGEPTEQPTEAPTEEATEEPTDEPTEGPTEAETEAPTEVSTEAPTDVVVTDTPPTDGDGDGDGDGAPSSQDCDDADPDVYPGADEGQCSEGGKDLNCDGQAPEPCTWAEPPGIGCGGGAAGTAAPLLLLTLLLPRRRRDHA